MKKFLLQLCTFSSILVLVFLGCLLLPTTPRASKSLLVAKNQKDALLKNTKPPRIIFVGGSNLSFGLNSKMIQDALNMNPINTGIHASIGLIYMMDTTLPYIRYGDIVVVIPEYVQFYGTYAYGGNELLRTVMDVSPSDLSKLNQKQWQNILKYFPKYALTKLMPNEYINVKEDDIYGVNSFNKYGDVYTHWQLEKQEFESENSIDKPFNTLVINELYNFEQKLLKKGAIMLVSFPGYQSSAFAKNRQQISRVEAELKKKKFALLGTPEEFMIPEDLMFNTSYHLTKEGVDYRTMLLIDYIREYCHRKTVAFNCLKTN